jgi:hypothetical protein
MRIRNSGSADSLTEVRRKIRCGSERVGRFAGHAESRFRPRCGGAPGHRSMAGGRRLGHAVFWAPGSIRRAASPSRILGQGGCWQESVDREHLGRGLRCPAAGRRHPDSGGKRRASQQRRHAPQHRSFRERARVTRSRRFSRRRRTRREDLRPGRSSPRSDG